MSEPTKESLNAVRAWMAAAMPVVNAREGGPNENLVRSLAIEIDKQRYAATVQVRGQVVVLARTVTDLVDALTPVGEPCKVCESHHDGTSICLVEIARINAERVLG